MNAYKARYHDGIVQLLEQPPKEIAKNDSDVVVLFPEEKNRINQRDSTTQRLMNLAGIMNVGGDAVKDSEDIYDE